MIIAVTRNDEINMIVCQIASSLFDISKKIAEDRLLPYIEKLDNQTQVAITGVSCRHQIEDLSEKTPKHILEIFAENIV